MDKGHRRWSMEEQGRATALNFPLRHTSVCEHSSHMNELLEIWTRKYASINIWFVDMLKNFNELF